MRNALSFWLICTLGASLSAQDSISIKPLNFDRENKRWEFQIGNQRGFADLSESKDIAKDYRAIDALVKSNKLSVELTNNLALLGSSENGKFKSVARIPLVPKIEVANVQGGSFKNIAYGIDQKVSDFVMVKTAVTQELYQLVSGVNPSAGSKDADSATRPVENVTWIDAVLFCNRLSQASGLSKVYAIEYGADGKVANVFQDLSKNGWRLPTLAEYEFAARGGLQSKSYYFAGANKSDPVAWTALNSGGKSHPVGTKSPNELGIYDLSGNVSTWTWNLQGFQGKAIESNNQGPWSSGFDTERAVMGGSFKDKGWDSPLAIGSHVDGWKKYAAEVARYLEKSDTIGIRLVRSTANPSQYQPNFLKDVTFATGPSDPDKLLSAVQAAGINRLELDKALRPLVSSRWTTDPAKVFIKNVKPSALPPINNAPWDPLPAFDIEFDSQDAQFKWTGSYTCYLEAQNIVGLAKTGKLHAEIDWEIVPLSPSLYAHRISNIRLVAQSKKGGWQGIYVLFNPARTLTNEAPIFNAFLANSFELGSRSKTRPLSFFKSVKVEGNSELQTFYMAQTPVTMAQLYVGLDMYDRGNIRREGIRSNLKVPLGEDGVVGYYGKALVSPSSLFEPTYGISYSASAKWCNIMSAFDGLEPVYKIDNYKVVADMSKNGWRLPTALEFEWARKGGNQSRGVKIYSGSDNPTDFIVPLSETEGGPWLSGFKKPNELGLYDMFGNVKHWVNDLSADWAKYAAHLYVGFGFADDPKDMIDPVLASKYLEGGTRLELVQDGAQSLDVGFRPVRPDGKPVVMAKKETKTETKPETKPETKVEPKTETKAESRPKLTANVDLFRVIANGKLQKKVKGSWSDFEIQLENPRLDHEGNLWSITSKGELYKLDGSDKKLMRSGVIDLGFGGRNQVIYAVTSAQKIEYSYEGKSWIPLDAPFAVTQIALGKNNQLWALSQTDPKKNGKIYRYQGSSWEEVKGLATTIAVDSDGAAWVTNEANELYRWNNYAKEFWSMDQQAIRAFAGESGDMFILGTWNIGEGYQILKYNGRESSAFDAVGGGAMVILPK